MPIGAGLATLLVPLAVPLLGWRGTWLVDAGLAACVLIAVTWWVPPPAVRRPTRPSGLAEAVRSRGVLLLALLFGCYAGLYLALVGLLPAVLVESGVGLAAAGLIGGLVYLVNAPGNLLGAALLHRGVPRRRLFLAGSGATAVTVWGVLDPDLPLALRVASALTFSFVAGVVPASIFSGVAALSAGTPSAGASVGVLQQGSSLGQLTGPPLVVASGAALGTWGGPAVLTGMAVLVALTAFAWPDPEEERGRD